MNKHAQNGKKWRKTEARQKHNISLDRRPGRTSDKRSSVVSERVCMGCTHCCPSVAFRDFGHTGILCLKSVYPGSSSPQKKLPSGRREDFCRFTLQNIDSNTPKLGLEVKYRQVEITTHRLRTREGNLPTSGLKEFSRTN